MVRVTQKQETFLKNIIYKGMSQREAYRNAYDCEKMKDKTIDECACKLLKNPKVCARKDEILREKEGVEFFGLSEREEKFVEGLILGKSQREAYKNAFNCKNMKDKTIDEKACRLFGTDKVKARHRQLQNRIIQESEKDAIMQGKEILQSLTKIARSNLGDVIKVQAKNGMVNIELREDFDLQNVKEIYLDRFGNLRVKMQSPIDAMTRLADLQNVKNQEPDDQNEIKVEIGSMQGLGD